MIDFIPKKGDPTANPLDEATDHLADLLTDLSATEIAWPDVTVAKADDGIMAEWFYPSFEAGNDFAEVTSILNYIGGETNFPDSPYGKLLTNTGFIEMKHWGRIGDFVVQIGGKAQKPNMTSAIKFTRTMEETLRVAISGEESTIEFYEGLEKKIRDLDMDTPTIRCALQLLARLVADEQKHLSAFRTALTELVGEDDD